MVTARVRARARVSCMNPIIMCCILSRALIIFGTV